MARKQGQRTDDNQGSSVNAVGGHAKPVPVRNTPKIPSTTPQPNALSSRS